MLRQFANKTIAMQPVYVAVMFLLLVGQGSLCTGEEVIILDKHHRIEAERKALQEAVTDARLFLSLRQRKRRAALTLGKEKPDYCKRKGHPMAIPVKDAP